VLDHIFNLTKKSYLTGRLYYDLTLFFDNLGVAYFFGHPVHACVNSMRNFLGCLFLKK